MSKAKLKITAFAIQTQPSPPPPPPTLADTTNTHLSQVILSSRNKNREKAQRNIGMDNLLDNLLS